MNHKEALKILDIITIPIPIGTTRSLRQCGTDNTVYPYNYTKEGVKEYGFQRTERSRELPKWGTQYEPWEV